MEHRCYFGKTLSGKTTLAKKDLAEAGSFGRLFVNLIDKERFAGYEQVNRTTPKQMIVNLLRNKRLVQYNAKSDTFDLEVLALKKLVMGVGNCIMVIDEVHLLKKKTNEPLIEIWTGGRHENVWGWSISQRPQLMDRTMLTQSTKYVFRLDLEDSWLKAYGIPMDTVPKENYKYIVI